MNAQRDQLRLPEDLEHIFDPALLRRPDQLTVACWVFPQWHPSPTNDKLYGTGWTEYVQMRGCAPWFPGHHQPRTPLLGELNERLPSTWETYNSLAKSSGVDVFVFDWYWYDDGPFLHEALEEGFLQARNRDQVRFAVMFTNHTWAIWYPTAGYRPTDEYLASWETSGLGGYELAFAAPECREEVWRALAYMIARYFHLPGYWRINDEPVLPIWDMSLFVRAFGLEGTRALLAELRAFARTLGHKGIYFHAMCQEPGVQTLMNDFAAMGVQSYSLYNAVSVASGRRPDEEELPDYGVVAADVVTKVWPEYDAISTLPCFPNISPGSDNAPRVLMRPRGGTPSRQKWPGTPIVVNDTPTAFEALARAALGYLNQRPDIPPIVTIGCWNEWTEGHYLLPDTRYGFGMARALGRALGVASQR